MTKMIRDSCGGLGFRHRSSPKSRWITNKAQQNGLVLYSEQSRDR